MSTPTTTTPSPATPSATVRTNMVAAALRRILIDRSLLLAVLLIAVLLVFGATVPYFFTFANLSGSTAYAVEVGLLALAESIVILTGRGAIDLSVGSMVSLAGMLFGLAATRWHLGLAGGVAVALLSGLAMGAVNGFLIARMRFPALIVTLATLYAFGAVPLVLTDTVPISELPSGLYGLTQYLAGIPMQVFVIYLPVIVIVWFALNRTGFGRRLYAVGTNDIAAQFAGLDVARTRFWAYTLSGLLSGLTAIVATARFASARPDAGVGMELMAITIAVLGGVAINGGEGKVSGVVLATFTVTVINNAMSVANFPAIWQVGALGVILLLAALLNSTARRVFGGGR
ncbi:MULTISPECIES: ABC transporter permease [Streptomyces]|uniref:ABC transporter permease n=1 Tax=Streptomyces TaxID=1883 RepID=UPI000692547D|nr:MULTISPECIES: ABC transporter permease [Streptomyces]